MIFEQNGIDLKCIEKNNSFKCTQCGNIDFIKIRNYPYSYSYDAGEHKSKYLEIYVCNKCGHIEQFYLKFIKRNNELDSLMKENEEIQELKANIDLKKKYRQEVEKQVDETIEEKINDLEKIIINKNNTVLVVEHAQKEMDNLKNLKPNQKFDLIGVDINDLQKIVDDIQVKQRKLRELENDHKTKLAEIDKKYQNEF